MATQPPETLLGTHEPLGSLTKSSSWTFSFKITDDMFADENLGVKKILAYAPPYEFQVDDDIMHKMKTLYTKGGTAAALKAALGLAPLPPLNILPLVLKMNPEDLAAIQQMITNAKNSVILDYDPPQKETLTMTDLSKAAAQIAEALAPALAPMLAQAVQKLENDQAEPKQGKADVSVKHPDGSETTAVEMIGKPKLFNGPVCEIGVSAGRTINLGNYNSGRVDVSVKIPCAHAELDLVYEFALKWVDDRISKIIGSFDPSIYAKG